MTSSRRFDELQQRYRAAWDAHQVIADFNAQLLQAGKQPSNEQLIIEERTAEAVLIARDELLAALTDLQS